MNVPAQISQQLTQQFFSSLEVGLVVLDENFNVEVWNQFMQSHSNIAQQQALGKNLFALFPEIDEVWFRSKVKPVFQLNTPAYIIAEQRQYLFRFDTYRPVTSASKYMHQNVSLFPLTDASGKVTKVCIVVYDVTDEMVSRKQFADANNKLKRMSRIDGLTSLNNRRYWEECAQHEYKRLGRSRGQSSLIILDIDHFKKINDTYGHPAGDEVIRYCAEIIRKTTRETDVCGRYGGEEFTILLPDTDAEQAILVGERLRRKAALKSVDYDGEEIDFTISVGIAEFHPRFNTHTEWLEAADKALYRAKQGGRNQVVYE